MKLKFLFGFLILFVLLAFVQASDDLENADYFENSTDISLGDFNFTIPEGFGLNGSAQIKEYDDGRLILSNSYIDNESDVLTISVNERGENYLIITDYTPEDVEYDKVSINNHSGVKYRMENSSYFIYFENGYVISIQAPNDDYFEEIIH